MKKNKLKLCIFGTYDKSYTSNKLIFQGLDQNNVSYIEVNSEVKITRLDTPKEMGWFQLILRILKKYRIFVEIFKNIGKLRKIDAIYVGYPGHFDVLIAYPIAKIFGKKLVFNPLLVFYTGFTEEQGILEKESLLGKVIKWGESRIYKMCDLVFADTPLQKEYFMKIFGIPEKIIRVLPIGADNKYYRYTPYTNLAKKINMVYYGLYSPVHGVEHIIEAANILRNDTDIKFTFVGQGQTFQKNYDKAKQLKLKNVEFFHDIPLDQHPAIIEKADIFLGFLQKHPSVERIIPNKIYQGLALNKVVLTADAPVTRSLFKHKENIYLCPPANPAAFVKALIDLKNNPTLRKKIAENGYGLYSKQFTPKAVGKNLIEFIQKAL